MKKHTHSPKKKENIIKASLTAALFPVTLTLFGDVPFAAYASDIQASPDTAVQGEVIACFRTDTPEINSAQESRLEADIIGAVNGADEAEALLQISEKTLGKASAAYDETETLGYAGGVITLVSSDTLSTDELLAELRERDDVIFAEPNIKIETASTGDYSDLQYNASGEYGMGVAQWNTYLEDGKPDPGQDTSGVVVAVLDSGVDYLHEDLRGVMWDEGESYPSLTALGGGKYGICTSKNNTDGVGYSSADPMDDYKHGTHVAGIIAAQWNKIGVSGIASGARIMAVKISNNSGTHTLDEAVRGYEYVIEAKKAGVNVRAVNNSWHDSTFGHTIDMLVREAGELGIVSCFAAGNRSFDIDNTDLLQSAFYDNPYAVVVGASDAGGSKAEFSNYGKRSVDVFAPGDKIYSTIPRGQGEVDTEDEPYEKDGIVFDVDYSDPEIRVEDGKDNSVFGFHSPSEFGKSILSKETIEGAGEVLKAVPESEGGALMIESEAIGDLTGSAGLAAELYTEKETSLSMSCWDAITDDEITESSGTIDLKPGLNTIGVRFPKEMDVSNLRFALSFDENVTEIPDKVYIKRLRIVKNTLPYGYDSGTSMATPGVTAVAATVTAAFPGEPADKIAARIKGSVMHRSELDDICKSGGIVRLDKALAGDTDPVIKEAHVNGNSVTLTGFFFGGQPGNVSVAGLACEVASWNDEEITFTLPEGITEGEQKIEVISEMGRSGCIYKGLPSKALLYDRLPLPGRSVSGTPGTYTVTSDEFDDTFYCNEIKSLVGLDGSMYAIVATKEQQTSIYRYDISGRTWENVYTGGHEAAEGACTWKGKLLFFAIDEYESNTYLGVFDPETKDVTFTLTDDKFASKNQTLVNTSKGVFSVGGDGTIHGKLRVGGEHEGIMKLDEDGLSFKEMKITGYDGRIYTLNPGLVADEDGNLYIIGGSDDDNDINICLKAEISGNEAKVRLLSEDKPIIADPGQNQGLKLSAAALKNGVIFSGRVAVDDTGRVIADTFTGGFGDTLFEPAERLVSLSPVHSIATTAYKGMYYALGMTNYEEGKHVFIGTGVDTALQYGDTVRINALSGEGGSWESEGVIKSYVGGSIELKVKAEEGFKIKDLTVDGVPVSDIELDTFIKTGAFALSELTGDHEVNVTFAQKDDGGSDKKETEGVTETGSESESKEGTQTGDEAGTKKSSAKSVNKTVPAKSGDEVRSVNVAIAAGAGIAVTVVGMRLFRRRG